jgi:hypothetical protein
MMFIYVIAVYVSSDPGTYIVRIRFAFQNRVWQYVLCMKTPLIYDQEGIWMNHVRILHNKSQEDLVDLHLSIASIIERMGLK